MTLDSASVAAGRWPEGSIPRIANAVALALLNQAALVVPLVAIAPWLVGDRNPFEAPRAAFPLLAIIAFLQAGLVVGVGLLGWSRVSLRGLGWYTDDWRREVRRGLVGFGLVAVVVFGTQAAVGGGPAVSQAWEAILHYSPAQRFLFLLIGVVAAFGEESIFRGYLQPSLIQRMGATGGVLMTAAFFAIYHLQFAPLRLLDLLLIGLVYGVLRGRDRSLFAPAVAHSVCWAVLGPL
jgi:membrane protease YdiL (CAAX protease family)